MLLIGYYYCNLFINGTYLVLFAKSVTLNGGRFSWSARKRLEWWRAGQI